MTSAVLCSNKLRLMPDELSDAHRKLGAAVEKAYGRKFADDAEHVAFFFVWNTESWPQREDNSVVTSERKFRAVHRYSRLSFGLFMRSPAHKSA